MLHIELLRAFELAGLGLVVGAISPTFGIGGGLITVPLLILLYGMSSSVATATSLGVIIFVSLSGTLAYIRERRIDFRVGFLFVLFAVPGSLAGGFVSNWLRSLHLRIDILQILFGGTMLVVAVMRVISILRRSGKNGTETAQSSDPAVVGDTEQGELSRNRLVRDIIDRRGVRFAYGVRLFPGMIVAFVGGFFGAMLGLGGGIIYVPILTGLIGLPAAIATATSTFTILFANPFAVVVRFASIRWDFVLFLSLGVVVSASIVPRFLHRVQAKWLLIGFWTLAFVASSRLLLKVVGVNI
jgi:hypothetical protein